MIDHHRFLVRSTDDSEWRRIREAGVSATTVSKAATPSGYAEIINERNNPTPFVDNGYMAFGRDNEAWIVASLKDEFGIFPNDWLIAAEGFENRWQFATPDGLSLDHETIAEVKTTGKDWGTEKSIPIQYRRQVQWQLYVTGAARCVFGWVLRVEQEDGTFVPGWFEPKVVIFERDEKMIEELVEVAQRLQEELVFYSQTDKEGI
jgi:hypothetical protein